MPIIANWLRPTDVLGSIQAGVHAGLSLRAQDQAREEAEANREERARLAADSLKERTLLSSMRLLEVAADRAERAGFHKESVDARRAADALHDRHNTMMEQIAQQNADTSQQRADDLFSKILTGAGTPERVDLTPGHYLQGGHHFEVKNSSVTPRVNPVTDAARRLKLLSNYSTLKDQWKQLPEGAPGQGDVEDQLITAARGLNQPQLSPISAPPPSASQSEVIRLTKEGRKAVFNADTKEFLRYAD